MSGIVGGILGLAFGDILAAIPPRPGAALNWGATGVGALSGPLAVESMLKIIAQATQVRKYFC
jgi:hypothetical protein